VGKGANRAFTPGDAVPTFGANHSCNADVGTALRAFAHPTRLQAETKHRIAFAPLVR
jgi:hypothetical protein